MRCPALVAGAAWLLLSLSPSAGLARETAPALLHGWMVDRWSVDDGLPLDHVRDMAIDTDGFVWFGTFDGIARFDGRTMRVLRRGNVPELPSNRLPFLEADPRGGMWALSEGGDILRFTDRGVQIWPVDGPLVRRAANRFATLRGQPYAFGVGGIFRLDPQGPVQLLDPLLGQVTSLDVAPDGSLWFTSKPGGLFRLDAAGPKRIVRHEDAMMVTHLPDGRRLLGAGGRLSFVGDDGQRLPVPGQAPESFCEVVTDADGSLLFRTKEGWYRDRLDQRVGDVSRTTCRTHTMALGGRWLAVGKELLLDGQPVLRADVSLVGIAPQGEAVWVFTDGDGVMRVRPRLVDSQSPPGLTGDDLVYALLAEQDGQAWTGTDRHGVWSLLPEPRPIEVGEDWRHRHILSLVRGPGGEVWVGSDYGVCEVVQDRCEYVLEDHSAVRALHVDGGGVLWAATADGVLRDVDREPREVLTPEGSIRDGRVFAEAGPDELWVGTVSEGAVQLQGERSRRWTVQDGLSSARIRSFLLDGEDVWVGTGDGGVCRIRPATAEVACITTDQGLHDDCIHTLLLDDEGRVWMSTNRGIFFVPLEHMRQVVDGSRARVQSVVLGEADGMRNREGNGGQGSVSGRDSQGRFWFATQEGIAVVDPTRVRVPEPPRVHLQQVWVDGERVPNGPLDLSPAQRQLKVSWTAAEMQWPDDVRFRFRLAPHDAQWRGPTTDREAVWLELPPGPFAVEVQASLAGAWSPSVPLRGVRQPAFDETPWYLATLLGLALSALGATMWWRGRAQRQRQVELEGEVAKRTAGLELTTRELQRQNEEIAAQHHEIAVQAERLEELDALRKRLVADLSHELRTPLALVAGPLQDLADNAPSLSPSNQKRLEVVQRSVGRLQDLVGQLFDLTRLEHGRLPLRARQADLAKLLRAVAAGFAASMGKAGIELRTEVEGAHPVYFDADLIEKVLGNLLSNALKFTPSGGQVTVSLQAEAEGIRVRIRDTGIGVEPAAQARLFDRFYQADQGDQRRFGGAGIGLALCRELVELHGGEIGLDSTPGSGSTFWFVLPRGVAHLAPSDIDTTGVGEPLPLVPSDEPPPEDAVTVLVVEDHPDMRHYLAAHLGSHFQVVEVADGQAALDQVAAQRPSAVVSDIMMPVMDGLTLARALKADPTTADIPVVLVSAKATEEDRAVGLEVADAYLSKPVRMRELLETVASLTGTALRSSDDASSRPEADVQLLQRLVEVAERRLAESQFGVKELASDLAMSPRQLQRTVRRLTGVSPSDFLRQRRMDVAQGLLRAGTYSTTAEVAAQVGLTPSYFSRLYSNWFGHPPSEDQPGAG